MYLSPMSLVDRDCGWRREGARMRWYSPCNKFRAESRGFNNWFLEEYNDTTKEWVHVSQGTKSIRFRSLMEAAAFAYAKKVTQAYAVLTNMVAHALSEFGLSRDAVDTTLARAAEPKG